jgi:C1A family cysteine protease
MQRKKYIQFTIVLLLSAGLSFLPYHAGAEYTSQQVENVKTSQAASSAALGAETTEQPTEQTTGTDYIADNIVVPALGADISKVQALENTDTSLDQSTNQQPDSQGQASVVKGTQTAIGELPPSSYDSRNYQYVTPPKKQTDNTCWTYSAVAAAETDMIALGKKQSNNAVSTAENTDYSEDHLAYYFYHMPKDPMGNTNGDATIPQGDYRNVGGNHVFTTFALADWYGLADESETAAMKVKDTTDGMIDDWANNEPPLSNYPDRVHLQKAYWISLASDTSNVKKMIQKYGSVAISMYYSGYYYNALTNSYYNSAFSNVNHAVQVIGWDDNYDKNKFSTASSDNGAWLVKNSPSGSATNYYFWVSYKDAALNAPTAKAFVFDFERADNYEHIYQYDGSASAYTDIAKNDSGYRVASNNSIANVFTVPKDNATGYQKLSAVSFALYTPSVDYRVQIYKNPTNPSNPESGTPLLASQKTGKTTFVGYYTVPLDESLILANGDTFSVVVTLSKSAGEDISYFVDKSYTNGSWIKFVNKVSAGQSFAKQNGGWQDLATVGVTARVKAFTDDYQVPATSMKISEDQKTLWKGDTAQLKVHIMPATASYQTSGWSSSNAAVVTVDKNGVLKAVDAGTAVITAKAKDNSGLTTSCIVSVQQPVERIENRSSDGNIVCMMNQTVQLQLQLYPENTDIRSVYFQSQDVAVATVDSAGQITGCGAGTTTIQVFSAYNKQLLLSCDVTVRALNDTKLDNSKNGQQMVVFDSLQKSAKSVRAPKTGDETPVGTWIILMVAGIFTAVFAGRKLLRR